MNDTFPSIETATGVLDGGGGGLEQAFVDSRSQAEGHVLPRIFDL